MTNLQVAQTILQQLGGGRFIAMTGSKDFVGSENCLSFRVGRNDKGITHVRITLTAMDDYQCEFLKIRGASVKPVAFRDGVYADQLREVFTSKTGLYTSMGTMGRAA